MKKDCFYCEGSGFDIFFKPAACPHCMKEDEVIEYKIKWFRDSEESLPKTIKIPKGLTEKFILDEMMKNYPGNVASLVPVMEEEMCKN